MKYIKTYEGWFTEDRFKVGDIITCIRYNSFAFLNKNKSYIVTDVDGDLVKVDNHDEVLNRTRFRLATPEEIEKYKFNNDINKFNL